MASSTFILLAASLLVATSSAAPQNTKFGITIPEECRGKGFCSIRPEGYDEIEARINSLLPVHLLNVGSRSGGGGHHEELPEDDDNCPSETTWESFYFHNDPNRLHVDIIVQTKLFRQEILKVTCKYDTTQYNSLKEGDSQCFKKLGLRDHNIVSTCEESLGTRSLLVYDPETHQLSMNNNYTIPVCCSCIHRRNPGK